VLQSDYPHLNVVVVDDGSQDRTYELASRFEKDRRVKVFSQFNRGKAAALNRALDETDQEVLVCIDADSQIHRKAISHLMAHFNDPSVGAVAGRVVVGNRQNILTALQALEYITAQSIERRAKENFNAIPVVPGAIGAWRTNAILEAGIFSSETSTEDADMTMAVIRSDYRVVYEEKAIATTEAPRTVHGLLQQRLRWNLGMMQAGWKHGGAFLERRALGFLSLIDLFLFGYLMPLLAPFADLFLLLLAFGAIADLVGTTPTDFSVPLYFLVAYLALPLLDLVSAFIAFRLDPKEDKRLLLLFPIQRLFYRPLLYISVYRSVWRALSGTLARWGSVARVGYRFDHERVA
jgi:cellulose synthase/poly-beta-1,6-N-acetylglucosamine synthase-like glycosyltransferase